MGGTRRILVLAGLLWPALALAQGTAPPAGPGPTPAPADAKLYFIAPVNGARIKGPFAVQFGLRNMGVTQAGSTAANAGHHHLLIDAQGDIAPNEPIPADKNHVHFGGGQTETRLDLAAGRHTLQLVLGDADHRPFRPSVASEKIEITVVEDEPAPKRAPRKRKPRRNYY